MARLASSNTPYPSPSPITHHLSPVTNSHSPIKRDVAHCRRFTLLPETTVGLDAAQSIRYFTSVSVSASATEISQHIALRNDSNNV